MANITKTKQERVPILFALGLVLVLALIAITLVSPNKRISFRGKTVTGLASVGQLAQYSDADYARYMSQYSDGTDAMLNAQPVSATFDLTTGASISQGSHTIWDSPETSDFFGGVSVSGSQASNSYSPFDAYFSGGNSSVNSLENLYAGSAVTTPSAAAQAQSAANSVGNAVNSAFGSVFGSGSGSGAAGSAGSAGGTGVAGGSGGVVTGTAGNFSAPTSAAGKNTGVNKAAATAVNCTGTACQFQNPLGPKNGSLDIFLNSILDVIILVGGIVVVIMIILAGLKYVTAQGDEGKIESAHKQLTWTVVGAGILLGAKVIALVIQNTVKALT